jgi:hypothetical protein
MLKDMGQGLCENCGGAKMFFDEQTTKPHKSFQKINIMKVKEKKLTL